MTDTSLPIPPLDPTWYDDGLGRRPFVRPPIMSDVIFKMRADEYMRRMEYETHRLQRERHLEMQLAEKTQMIVRLTQQIRDLQAMRMPTVPALRQAYAESRITQEELERLLLYVLGGER